MQRDVPRGRVPRRQGHRCTGKVVKGPQHQSVLLRKARRPGIGKIKDRMSNDTTREDFNAPFIAIGWRVCSIIVITDSFCSFDNGLALARVLYVVCKLLISKTIKSKN